jgi:hypothetical protein
MDSIVVAAKSAESTTEIAWGNIKLMDTSLVKLPVRPEDVATVSRSGNNLIVTLKSGEQITIGDFFVVDATGAQSELVLEGDNGMLWQANYGEPFTGFTFTELSAADELLLAGAVAGTAMPGWMLAALGLVGIGAGAAAAGGGGGGGGGGGAPAPVPPVDTTAPDAPTGLQFAADGSSVSGRAESNATVTVRDAQGNVVGTGVVDANGNFQIIFPAPQANGESLQITVTDPAGNVSAPITVTAPDVTAPVAPGGLVVSADGSTLTGSGEPGATVVIKNAAGATVGSAVVAPDGTFTVTLDPPQANGEGLSVTQTDAAGNESASAAITAPDITAPGAPANLGISADGTTLTGTGEPGATVVIANAAGAVLGSAVVGADGTFSLTLNPAQINGESLVATQTDAAGNLSPAATVTAPDLTPDNTAPDAPSALLVSANGAILTGKGEVGAIVSVTNAAGVVVATGIVDADGNFRLDLSPAQANGQILSVTLEDASGNVSLPATVPAPDIEAPPVPSSLSVDTAGLILSGITEAGATVVVRDAAGVIIGSGTANADGSFQITLNSPQVNGETLNVVATDAVGNASLPAELVVPDVTPPAPITDLIISADGFFAGGNGEPGDTVTITNAAGDVLGSARVNAFGRFVIRFAVRLTPGEELIAVQTDDAGNLSSTVTTIVPDDVGPGTPDNLVLSSDGFTLTGTGTATDTVRVYNAQGTLLGTATVNPDGTFSVVLDTAQTNGEILTIIATDFDNETSVPITFTAPDSTAPAAVANVAVNADGTAVTGTGEPGATVTVRDAQGNIIGTATVNQAGNFAVTINPAQADGQLLSVTQTDASGNVSPAVDAQAPDVTPGVDLSNVLISADGTVVSGRGQPGDTVTVRGSGGAVLASGVVSSDGSFNLTLVPAQTNGQQLVVSQQDAAGNASPVANVTAPDLDAPATPSGLTLDGGGNVLSGVGEAGTTVTVKDAAGTVLGTAVVAADGTFQVSLSSAQANGQVLTVSAADAAGNTSASATLQAADTTAPQAVSNLQVSADGVTLTGQGEPGATVAITNAVGAVIGTATVGANGSFSVTLSPAAVEGDVLSAVQTDAAGNPSLPATITAPDADGPGTPGNLAVSNDGLQLTGTGTAGNTVNVYDAQGTLLGTGTVAANGSFTIALSPAQNDGQVLDVIATDGAGENSVPVEITAPDSTAPDALTNLAISNNGTVVTGNGEAGDSVTVRGPGGTVIGTGTVSADGSFSITLTSAQTNAQLLQVTQTDAAGNISTPAAVTAPDLTPPAAVTQVSVSNDGLTVTGQGEAGATVTVTGPNGAVLGTATVGADGLFSVGLGAAQTNGQNLGLVQADAAGNRSPVVTTPAPDTDIPAAPSGLLLNATGTVLNGIGEAGATVRVLAADGSTLGTATVAANGTFQVTLTPAQTNGQLLEVTQTDAVGHVSVPTPITAGDTTAPAAPTGVVLSRDGLTVTGSGEAGATVTVRSANGLSLGTAVVASDGSFTVALNSAQLNGERLTVGQADAANNASPTVGVTAADITAPTAPAGLVLDASGLVLTGTGEAGATVRITNAQGAPLGSAVVGANGTFSITLSAAQTNGETLKAIATDAANNSSPATTLVANDTTAPVPVSNLLISPDGLTLSGNGEAGASVRVTAANGDLIGTGSVTANGTFVITLTRPAVQSDVLSVVETDAAGNPSTPTAVNGPDGTEPSSPSNLAITLDGLTLTGSAVVGNTVTVTNAQGTVLGTAVVGASGTFTVNLNSAQHNGELLTVQASDGTRVSVPSLLTASDDTPPAILDNLALSANGSTLIGTGEVGATVNVRVLGQVVGTGTVGADGTFSITFTPALNNAQVLTATQTDAAGNISAGVTVNAPDLIAPDAPSGLTLNALGTLLGGQGEAGASISVRNAQGAIVGTGTVGADGTFQVTLSPGQLTGTTLLVTLTDAAGNTSVPGSLPVLDVTAPDPVTALVLNVAGTTLTGKGEVGATVSVVNASGTVLGTAVVGANGSFTVTLSPAQANGQLLDVLQADVAGNVSSPVAVTASDITAPTALAGVAISANGSVVTGSGEAGATVRVLGSGGAVLGTAVVDANGQFSVPLSSPQINLQLLTVTQTDAAGNASANVTLVAPDLQAPAAPTDVALTPQGSAVIGKAEAGTTVTVIVSDAQGNVLGTATVAANGTFQVNLSTPQTNGQTLLVTSTDAAGNVSTTTTVIAADTTPPNPAVQLAVSPDGVLLSGKGEVGATVTVLGPLGTPIGSAVVGANGSFIVTLTPPATQGATLSVTLTDAAGNVSPGVSVVAPDANGPDQPTALQLSVDGLTLTGIADIGNTVTVRSGQGLVLGTATVGPDGTFQITLSAAQTNGQVLEVVASNGVINSIPGTVTAIDSTAPALTNVAISSDGTVVTGTGEAGARVTVLDAAGNPIGTVVVGITGAFTVVLTTPQLNAQLLQVTQSDPAGNSSTPAAVTAPDLTAPAPITNQLVSNNGLTLTGNGEAGATVTVLGSDGQPLGTAVVGSNGAFSVTLSSAQTNGQTLTLSQSDVSGNKSPTVSALAPDTEVPAAPTALVLNAGGTLLTGQGEAGAIVHVLNANGVEIGTATVGANGRFEVTLPAQTAGQPLTVNQSDAAGNTSPSTPITAPDTTAPLALTNVGLSNDGLTVSGRGEVGATVTVRSAGGVALGTAVVGTDGSFSATLSAAQLNGERLSVTQADASNNVSPVVNVTAADITAPDAPGTLSLNLAGTVLTGSGEIGAAIRIVGAQGTVLGTGTVGSDGLFSIQLSAPQANGQTLRVTATDAANNVSAPASVLAADTTPPVAVSNLVISPNGATLSGNGEAGASLRVTAANGDLIGTGTVGAGGTFIITLTRPAVPSDVLTVIETDAAGNPSLPAQVNGPDGTGPATPANLVLSVEGAVLTGTGTVGSTIQVTNGQGTLLGSGTVNQLGVFSIVLQTPQHNGELLTVQASDGNGRLSIPVQLTAGDDTAPALLANVVLSANGAVVTGTGEAGATVVVRNVQGQSLGSALVGTDGAFTLTLTTPQTNLQVLTATQVDAAGNVSLGVNITAPDLVAPLAPVALALNAVGTVLSGQGEAGASITVRDALGAVVGTGTVAANGSFQVTLTTPQTNGGALQVSLTDAAGNVSLPGALAVPDTTAPVAVLNPLINANGTLITGTGEAGATVTVTNAAGTVLGTALVAANGTFSVTLTPAQANGQPLDVAQTDVAGNVSVPVLVTAPDITPPVAMTGVAISADGAIVTGRGEAGATVRVFSATNVQLGTALVDANGLFSVTLSTAQVNLQTLTVTQSDVAGNLSASVNLIAPDLLAPVAPTDVVLTPQGSAVIGKAEPGTVVSVVVSDAQGNVLGTSTVAANGTFQVDLSSPQINGQTLLVTSTDAAGNVSTTTIIVAADITPPAPPIDLVVGLGGTVLAGKGEAGATFTVRDAAGLSVGTGTVAANGSFTVTLTRTVGDNEVLSVTLTDVAGNTSAAATVIASDIDGPDQPTALTLTADGLILSGVGNAGNTITVRDLQGNVLGSGVVDGSNNFQITLNAPQTNGQTLEVSASDGTLVSLPAQYLAADITPPADLANLAVSADGLLLSGRGEAGATVTVTGQGNVVLGTAVVGVTGAFTVTLSSAQINNQVLTVVQADVAGNISNPGTVLAGDRTAPDAPVALTLSADGAVLSGVGEANARVTVSNAQGVVLGTGTVLIDGTFQINLGAAQLNGQALGVTLTDAAGNVSVPGNVTAVDTTAPAALTDLAISNAAIISSLVTGKGEAGALVTVTNGAGTVLGTATVTAGGSFSVTLTPAVATGEPLTLVQRDAAGNTSLTASINSPDTTPPAALTGVAINATTGATLTGQGEPGATVTVRNAAGTVLGTAVVAPDNTFVVTLTPPQINQQGLTVAQADAAGNVSVSTPVTAPDLTPPAVPTQLSLNAAGTLLSGVGEANTSVSVKNAAGVELGTGTVNANGTFQVTVPAQLNGQSLVVTLTDLAGNVSGPGSLTAVDTTPPAPATILALDVNGVILTGTGEAGARLAITNNLGQAIGTGTVNADGTYSVTLTVPQINGEVVSVVQLDAAGNASAAVTVLARDILAPTALSGLTLTANGLVLGGIGEANARIVVKNGLGVEIGTATAGADGVFTVNLATAQLNGQVLNVTQADVAGNVSLPTSFPVPDVTAPLALTLIAVSGDGKVVTGRGEVGATVTVTGPLNAALGSAVVAADGTFSVTLTTPQTNFEALVLTQRDPAGNSSVGVTVNAPDLTPPALPTGLGLSANGLVFTGTAEAGARVFVTTAQGVALGNVIVGTDGQFSVPLSLAQLNGGSLEVYAQDAAGNRSPLATLTVPDVTAPTLVTQLAVNANGTALTGHGEAGATVAVTVVVGQTPVVLGTAVVDANGNFQVPLVPAALGGQLLTVIQTDAAGNPSLGATLNIPVELPPAAPVVGTLTSDGVTLTGTTEAGTVVTVRGVGGVLLGTGVTTGTTFTVTLNPPQANGQVLELHASNGTLTSAATFYTSADSTAPVPITELAINGIGTVVTGKGEVGATVTITNAANVTIGTGVVGANGSFAVVLLVPQANGGLLTAVQTDASLNTSGTATVPAPDITPPAAAVGISLSANGLTLSGTGEAGSVATVYNVVGTAIGTATVLPNGTFSVALNSAQLNGQVLSIKLADAAGNVSVATPYVALDTTPPAALTNVALATSGAVVTGQGEAGARVTVLGNGVTLGTGTVDAAGNFSVNLSAAQLNGQQLSVVQTDAANLSSPITALTARDVTAPNAPTALVLTGGLALTGLGEANTTVKVYGANNALLVTGQVNALGVFNVVLPSPQLNGGALKVTLTDGANNVSAAAQLGVADTTPPAAPTATVSASGTAVSGTGEAGATVTVRSGTTVLGTALVAADGSYSVSLNAAQINNQILTVTQADAANNVSPAVATTAPDLTPPPLASGLAVAVNGLSLSGSGEAGALVTVKAANGLTLGTGTVLANGTFTVTLNSAQINGEVLSVTLTDGRGNVSAPASVTALDVDVNEPVTASSNLAQASVNITPVSVNSSYVDSGTTLLLGQAKAYGFTVAANTVSDPVLTVTTTSLLGLLNNASFTLQVKNAAGVWVNYTNGSNGSVLDLLALSPTSVRADLPVLQAGDYRLVVNSGLVAILNTLTTQLDFTTTSLTQFTGTPVAVTGNVITDPGVNGLPDRVGPDGGAVLQVLKGGVYVTAGAGTTVQGLYGQLVIDSTGKYTYTPNGSVNSVGKVEDFSYQLVHPNGLSSIAHLYVRIDSTNVDEVWNGNNLAANATLVDATNDVASSAITLVGAQSAPATTSFTPFGTLLVTTTKDFAFSIAADTVTDVTLTARNNLSLISGVGLALVKVVGGVETVVANFPAGTLLGVGNTISTVVQGQGPGNYIMRVTSGGVLSTITPSVTQVSTSTVNFVIGSGTQATGNLFTDTAGGGVDVLGSTYTSLSVLSAGAFVLPGYNGVTIAGLHGSLLVNADGSYVYTPAVGQAIAVTPQTDVFTYQLTHPTGATDTATLTINLNNGASVTSFARLASLDSTDDSAVHTAASGTEHHTLDGTAGNDTLDGAQGGGLTFQGHEGNDTIVIYDQSFASVDGGTGTDTLKWAGGDADIDLSNLASRINNIEIIDLNHTSKVNLTLSLSDLLSVTDASTDKLLIQGDTHDTVHMTGATWAAAGPVQVDNGVQYNVYTAQEDPSHHLWVQSGISVV